MSKFCGVISNKPNHFHLAPIEFQHLEILTDWLLDETNHICAEFETKCEFMNDQQRQMLQNEQDLTNMHYHVGALNDYMLALEMEVAENEANLQQMERNVCYLRDQAAVHRDCLNCRNHAQMPRSEHESLWQLLQSTDRAMMQLDYLLERIAEYEQFSHLQTNPYGLIFAILDLHVRTLQQTDKNLCTLIDKTGAVDEALQQATDKIAISHQPVSSEVANACNYEQQ